jgi:hypothetical protein
VIKRKETLFIAEVRDNDGIPPVYMRTSTEAYTNIYILKVTLNVALTVVVPVCLVTGGIIIYKCKEIFNYISAKQAIN